jgi:hypothetical protein
MLLETVATTLGGAVTGMFVGDAMKAVPQKTAMPATSNSASTKTTADGAIVSKTQTARQSLWLSGFIVVAAIATLIGGSRVLKDARIG